METKEGQQTVEQKVETPKPQPEVASPVTAEEPNLQEQIAELTRKHNETVQALKGTQQSLLEKNRLLKEKEDVRGEIETLKNMVKILAVRPREDETDLEATAKQKSPDIDKAFAELENQNKVKEYQRKTQEQIDAIKNRVETLGLTENDESYWEIYKLATNATPADFKLADIRLKKLEKEKAPVDNKPTDEKDKTLEAMQKEIERLKKIVSGELDVEKGKPSGVAANEAQIRQAFRENPRNNKARIDYLELQKNKTK